MSKNIAEIMPSYNKIKMHSTYKRRKFNNDV